MKASIIASSLALFTAALASPMTAARSASPQTAAPAQLFTFSLTDDVTGASATSSVAINAGPVTLNAIFLPWATNLLANGALTATSALNVNPAVQNVFCVFTGNGRVIPINDRVTFADLDGNNGAAVQTAVGEFTIQCEQ